MKKVIAILLTVAMFSTLFVSGLTVSAAESYRVTYSAEEITDLDTIVMLANMEKASRVTNFSVAEPTATEQDEAEDLTYTQLLEVREYADGTEEKVVVTNTVRGESLFDVSTSQTAYVYTHVLTFYYRLRSDALGTPEQLASPIQIKPVRVVLKTTRHVAGNVNITGIELGYCAKVGDPFIESDNFTYNNTASLGTQTFTHYALTGYQTVPSGAISGNSLSWRGRAYIDYSNGTTGEMNVIAKVK